MSRYVYATFPIDHGWWDLPTVGNLVDRIENEAERFEYPMRQFTAQMLLADLEKAQAKARELGWEGDVRGSLHVFFVPTETDMAYGFAWKQENNGTTFIASPIPLPHFQED